MFNSGDLVYLIVERIYESATKWIAKQVIIKHDNQANLEEFLTSYQMSWRFVALTWLISILFS